MRQIPRRRKYVHNSSLWRKYFAKSLWSVVNNGVCLGIYVTTRLRPLINCRINKGRTSNRKRNFLMDCVCLNNILIQILRFPYFLFTNSTGKNSFHRHFKGYMKWKIWLEENPPTWKNFWSYKDWSLQLSRISFQSWDI